MIEQIGLVWVEDRSYTVLTDADPPHRCTKRGCDREAVAYFLRSVTRWSIVNPPRYDSRRWYCCPDHLYCRKIEDGKAYARVAPGSPAAERGYVG